MKGLRPLFIKCILKAIRSYDCHGAGTRVQQQYQGFAEQAKGPQYGELASPRPLE